jgi:hypothetical protein
MAIRLRQPLLSMAVYGVNPLSEELSQIILEELNVKSIIYKDSKNGRTLGSYNRKK